MNVKGVVKSIRKDRKGLQLISGEWYSQYQGTVACNRGDEVEIEYYQKGDWKNIKTVTILKKSETQGGGSAKADWSYRESYAKDILTTLISNNPDKKSVIELAGQAAAAEKFLYLEVTHIEEKPTPKEEYEGSNGDEY